MPSRRADNAAAVETGEDGQVVPIASSVESADCLLDLAGPTTIVLDTGSISASGAGVTVEGTTAEITQAGTYVVRGKLADGQIKVNAGRGEGQAGPGRRRHCDVGRRPHLRQERRQGRAGCTR